MRLLACTWSVLAHGSRGTIFPPSIHTLQPAIERSLVSRRISRRRLKYRISLGVCHAPRFTAIEPMDLVYKGRNKYCFSFLFFSFFTLFFFFLPSIHHDALLRATIERTTIDVEILKLKSKESTELSVPERLRELRMMYA